MKKSSLYFLAYKRDPKYRIKGEDINKEEVK